MELHRSGGEWRINKNTQNIYRYLDLLFHSLLLNSIYNKPDNTAINSLLTPADTGVLWPLEN